MATIKALTLIKPYVAPQYLVEPIEDCTEDDIAQIELDGYEVVDEHIMGWGEHNAIIRSDSSEGYVHPLYFLAALGVNEPAPPAGEG